MIVNSDE